MSCGRLVTACSALSVLGAAHAAVNAALLRRPPAVPPPVTRPVTVVLPVRDEEAQVGDCLAGVLAQRGVPDLRVVVVDDGSTDGTAEVVRGIADPRVRLVPAGALPPGWLGKPHACAAGVAAGPGRTTACWCSSTPTCGWPPTRWPARSRCWTTPGWTWSRRGRGR